MNATSCCESWRRARHVAAADSPAVCSYFNCTTRGLVSSPHNTKYLHYVGDVGLLGDVLSYS